MSINAFRETYVIAEKLFEHVKERYSEESLILVKQAVAFAEENYALIAHPTGKPYIQYAIEVAINLIEFRLDPIVISAALVYPPPPVEEKALPALKKTFKNQKELLALVDDILHLGQLEWSAWSLLSEQHELKGRKEILQNMYHLAIDDLVMNEETLQSEFHFQKKEKQVENLNRIHTELGDTYTGAKANGRYVRMDYSLKNGDIIEVSASRTRKGPNPDWLSKNRLDNILKSQLDTNLITMSSVELHTANTRKFLLPEWLYQSDKGSEQMYYVFARTRKARSKIRHALKHSNPQT